MQYARYTIHFLITAGVILCSSGMALCAEKDRDVIAEIPFTENNELMTPAQAPGGNSDPQPGCGSLEPRDASYCGDENAEFTPGNDDLVIEDIPESDGSKPASPKRS